MTVKNWVYSVGPHLTCKAINPLQIARAEWERKAGNLTPKHFFWLKLQPIISYSLLASLFLLKDTRHC